MAASSEQRILAELAGAWYHRTRDLLDSITQRRETVIRASKDARMGVIDRTSYWLLELKKSEIYDSLQDEALWVSDVSALAIRILILGWVTIIADRCNCPVEKREMILSEYLPSRIVELNSLIGSIVLSLTIRQNAGIVFGFPEPHCPFNVPENGPYIATIYMEDDVEPFTRELSAQTRDMIHQELCTLVSVYRKREASFMPADAFVAVISKINSTVA